MEYTEGAMSTVDFTLATADADGVKMRLEVVEIPVSDEARAKEFYLRLGWRLDDNTPPGITQFTPPGSACSVQLDVEHTSATPGSSKAFLIVTDAAAARDSLVADGVTVSELFHLSEAGVAPGPDPEQRSYVTLATFSDPDGNVWVLQQVTARLPGRLAGGPTSFGSVADLADALRRASVAHGEHEKRTGIADPDWPEFYASHVVQEQTGV